MCETRSRQASTIPSAIRSVTSRGTMLSEPTGTLAAVLTFGAILVDFDGTACLHDVAEHLLIELGDPSWPEYDAMVDRGELGLREAGDRQVALLGGTREEMLAFALRHCPLDPTFPPFVDWAERHAIPLTVISDGFGFYIEPILATAGLDRLEVISNEAVFDGGTPTLRRPHGHPLCVGCGTCKMNAVLRARERGPVVLVGEGQSDRYGALYADVVFAKDALVEIAGTDGVPFLPWETFDDVRAALEALEEAPGPVAPERCPGWRTA